MKSALRAFVIVLAVFAAYASAIPNGLVWDDTALVLRDPLIRSWRLIPEGFSHFLFLDATPSDFYRPLQRLVYTLIYWPFAVRPAAYHVANIICHTTAALALWRFARELLRRFNIGERAAEVVSFCAALLWAVHPVHTAAISYVSGLADPLSALFGFAALCCAFRTDEDGDRPRLWIYSAAAAFLFICSALSKESGFIFPALWLVVLLTERRLKAIVRWIAVISSVLVVYLSCRLPAEHIPAPRIHTPPPLVVRPLLVSRAVAEYALLLVWPANLHMDRDVETHPDGPNDATYNAAAARELETIAGAVLICAFTYAAWRRRARDRATFACLLLAAAAYLPVSGIVALNATVAEHWIYLPSAFLLIAICRVAARLLDKSRRLRIAVAVALAAVLFGMGTRTFIRNFDWKDERTFFARTIASGGDSARMLVNLANVEMNEGRFDDAQAHLTRALAKEPDLPFALLGAASLAIRRHDFPAAHGWLDRAAKHEIIEAQAQELRVVLHHHERGETDLVRMRLAARTGPPFWPVEKRYVRALAENGMVAAAVSELRTVLSREPFRAESWELLGELLERGGDRAEAAQAFAMANELDVHLAMRPKVL